MFKKSKWERQFEKISFLCKKFQYFRKTVKFWTTFAKINLFAKTILRNFVFLREWTKSIFTSTLIFHCSAKRTLWRFPQAFYCCWHLNDASNRVTWMTVSHRTNCTAVVGKHPDLMVGQPTSTVFPTNDRKFEISQFFPKNFEKV